MRHVLAARSLLSHLRAADVVKAGVVETHAGRQCRGVDRRPGARIDGDGVVGDDDGCVIPAGEHRPVVGFDEQRELAVGVVGRESDRKSVV